MPITEQELVYEAVVELLSHQLAYPVKWIATQDVLLDEMDCRIMVEIGPSNQLTNMARRTVAAKYQERDDTLGIRRQLLTSENDTSEIQFDQLVPLPEVHHLPQPGARPAVTEVPSSHPKPAAVPSSGVPDIAITAKEILVAMVAQKLKRLPHEIRDTDSIKALAGGRSTLENELVGDIEAEFSPIHLPERIESLDLVDLATLIEVQFRGVLGKKTSALMQKSVGSKMPGNFSLHTGRAYLEARWGLLSGRQDIVLLQAVAMPPKSRFTDVVEAQGFFDNLARQHFIASGLPVPSQGDQFKSSAMVTSIDPEALSRINENQNNLLRRTIELHARHLGIDMNVGANSATAANMALAELRTELAKWDIEHGQEYATGIRPLFDPRKIRFFSSSWAWALQEVIEIFHRLVAGEVVKQEELRHITRRVDSGIRRTLSYFLKVCLEEKDRNPAYVSAGKVMAGLIKACENCETSPFSGTATISSSVALHHSPSLRSKDSAGIWQPDIERTKILRTGLHQVLNFSLPLQNRNVLVTGAGAGSIGSEVVIRLIQAGSRVVVTTSSYSRKTVGFFNGMYVKHSTPGSQLIVVPFNQGSKQDAVDLIAWIYDPKGLGWDLDAVIPFAALAEVGREIDQIDSKSELAHRIMLTNTTRLIGAVRTAKEQAGSHHRPAQVILPLSANHGVFGGDGLYAESKLALEALFDKWYSESWGHYLSIAGCAIGWTRGTALMKGNDVLAEEFGRHLNVHTFSQSEMAANIVALLHPALVESMETSPIYADFNGGLDSVQNLSGALCDLRSELKTKREIEDAIAAEEALENPELMLHKGSTGNSCRRRANIQLQYPHLPDYEIDLRPLGDLLNMVDLDSVVVIAGFAELGPWGNSRTRWQMEASGTFSIEGWVEMAWMMSCIKYMASPAPNLMTDTCWVDVKKGTPIYEDEVEAKYGEFILSHSGIRLVEPELWANTYDPGKKEFFHEVVVEADLDPFETSEEIALAFKERHGPHIDIVGGRVTIKEGATIMVPKSVKCNTDVAGQIPTGFDPSTYGIPADIITQVDRTVLYALICTAEALFSAGITDPYEIYKYVHISEVGNCLGTGVGGISSAAKMFQGRSMEQQDVPQDILQETFLNTIAAWINMLLLSSSGPIRTPVGACATALESLDTAHDLIMTGKAKICLVGGVDDLEEHIAYEFANMKATNDSELDRKCGRTPEDMSRPTASDRRGFVESHGAGVQIVCTAKVAMEMGLPVYGIVAFSGTSSDGIGRSIPAPGKGVMVNARERQAVYPSPLLNLSYRRRQMDTVAKHIQDSISYELDLLSEETLSEEHKQYRIRDIEARGLQQKALIRRQFGTNFWQQSSDISPIRGSLAVWGLGVDDLNVASFHGTSTVKNELNECDIIDSQLAYLGHEPGNRILGIFQKYLTGHPKAPAAAWMLNGCLQMLDSGTIPGNRNADDIDPQLQQFNHIAFINKTIQTKEVKAAMVSSFGFGQKGAQAIIVHPKYLYAALEEDCFENYKSRTLQRQRVANAEFNRRMAGGEVFVAKNAVPYGENNTRASMVNPDYRVT